MPPPSPLQHLLEHDALGHATLLVGGSAAERIEVAEAVIQTLGVAPADVIRLAGVPNIETVRRALERLHLKPFQSPWVLGILEGVDEWSVEAANTILKTLEEPPAHAKLLLLAAHDASLLPTIRSRVSRIQLTSHPASPVGPEEAEIPALRELATQPLSESFTRIAALAEQPGVQATLASWIGQEATAAGRSQLLKRRTALASHPVNKRLTLEAVLLEYKHLQSLQPE